MERGTCPGAAEQLPEVCSQGDAAQRQRNQTVAQLMSRRCKIAKGEH